MHAWPAARRDAGFDVLVPESEAMDRSVGLLVLFAVTFFAGGLLLSAPDPVEVLQPVPFNHKIHATFNVGCGDCHFRCEKTRDEDGDLECDLCAQSDVFFCEQHIACPDHTLPGLPSVEVCASCHEGDDPETPAKAALMEYVDELRPIPWRRVTALQESNVFFSHRRHALLAKIDCKTCHGDVGHMESPPSAPQVETSMDWCLACHREQDQDEGCVRCHR
jgi:hypothetical protein